MRRMNKKKTTLKTADSHVWTTKESSSGMKKKLAPVSTLNLRINGARSLDHLVP